MGNCLVTKLKDSVSNDSLLTMDELAIYINTDINNGGIAIKGIERARVVGNGFIGNDLNTTPNQTDIAYNYQQQVYITFSPGTYMVILSHKRDITHLADAPGKERIGEIDFSSLKYANCYEGFWIDACQIKDGNLDLGENLARYGVFVTYSQSNRYKANIEKISYLSIGVQTSNETGVTGDIDVTAQRMFNEGRTSGDCFFIVDNTSVTDEGHVVTSEYLASKGGTNRITVSFNASGYTKSYS